MSDSHATPGAEPEYLGSDTPPHTGGPGDPSGPGDPGDSTRRRRSRSPWVVGAAALGLVGAAAGGWAAAQLFGGGDGPASAIPALAVGYVALDLDPTAAQKIEALRIAKKFPALAEELDLDVRDDLRRRLFEAWFADAGCDLDYAADVAPWIGDRFALAAVPDGDGAASPLVALAVSDRGAAEQAVREMEACVGAAGDSVGGGWTAVGPDEAAVEPSAEPSAEPGAEPSAESPDGPDAGEPVGVAFVGDYLLLAETQTDADSLAAAAEAAPLAEDPAFQEWMDAVGDPGVVTAYLSKDAPRLLTQTMTRVQGELGGDMAPGVEGFGGFAPLDEMTERSQALWKDFDGMASVVRFADGALEVEVVGRGLPGGAAEATGPSLGDLPAGTAAAFTHSLQPGWSADIADTLVGMLSAGESAEEFWSGLEAGSGLELPEDVERLLGEGLSLSVDGSISADGLMAGPGELPAVPVALRIAGDTTEIRGVLDKLLALAGPDAGQVVVEESDGLVAVGVDQAYVDRVLAEGGLAEQETFRSVLPEAERATSALFVDADAGSTDGGPGWLARLAGDDAGARANLEPFDALGVSSWREGDVQHGLLRLTTD